MKINSKEYKIFKCKIPKKNKGFTLIEIIIAFALFAIVMGGIYGIVISAMNINKDGEVKQTASLYGQEVLEEFKSGDITKDETGIIKLSNDIMLSQDGGKSNYKGEGYLDKDNKYYAKITVNKNTSITLDKDVKVGDELGEEELEEKSPETCDFNIALSGENNPIKVKVDKLSTGKLKYDPKSDEDLKLVINTKTKEDEKVVVIKDGDNNEILTSKNPIKKDSDKDNEIKLTFNFDEYKVQGKSKDESNTEKYKKLELSVFNQDDIPLNIILEKLEKVDVEVRNKLGNVKVYDNRSENNESSKIGQLYDIKVEITQVNNGSNPVFTGYSSQNINIK